MGANSHFDTTVFGGYVMYRHKVVCRDDAGNVTHSMFLFDVMNPFNDCWFGTFASELEARNFVRTLMFGKDNL